MRCHEWLLVDVDVLAGVRVQGTDGSAKDRGLRAASVAPKFSRSLQRVEAGLHQYAESSVGLVMRVETTINSNQNATKSGHTMSNPSKNNMIRVSLA